MILERGAMEYVRPPLLYALSSKGKSTRLSNIPSQDNRGDIGYYYYLLLLKLILIQLESHSSPQL